MIKLTFKIHCNVPRCYIDRWNNLKYTCEHGTTKELATKWTQKCNLKSNQQLSFTPRNGGVLGDPKKYICFRLKLAEWWNNDVYIVFDQIHASPPQKWTLEELDDLRLSFQTLCNEYVKANFVKSILQIGKTVIST